VNAGLIGQTFGRWTILAYRAPERLFVRCACGTECWRDAPSVKTGRSRSCGCLNREVATQRHLTHGAYRTPEHITWTAMKQRCLNPAKGNYRYYGGRGVTVCDRWRDSFAAFLTDVGPRPTAGHSLDRINPEGHYEPGNCRWATRIEQRHNRRAKVPRGTPVANTFADG
jgi:hypothetical protein